MTLRERRGWWMVASLFLVLLLVFGGGYNTVPVSLPAPEQQKSRRAVGWLRRGRRET